MLSQLQDGLTPLLAAASGGFAEVVSFLIAQGADINVSEKVSLPYSPGAVLD
jgi:ankyrin repeat protein